MDKLLKVLKSFEYLVVIAPVDFAGLWTQSLRFNGYDAVESLEEKHIFL